MAANIRETSIAWGFKKQNAIGVANVLAGIWKLSKVNATLTENPLNTESDAQDIGKGHEFETQSFLTNWDVRGQIDKFASAEFAAWAWGFALGKIVKSGVLPNFIYTITPLDPVADGIEPPAFSFLEAIRPGASDVIDRMYVGCVVEQLSYTMGSGPGRANHKIVIDFVGTGKLVEPSAIAHPAITAEKSLPQSSAAITINGTDYVTAKNFVSLEMVWRNNPRLDSGFFPGSGVQDGAAIRGRMEHGDRELTMNFVARFENGSDELTKLKAQTSGTATIQTTFDANNDLLITLHQAVFRLAQVNDTDGLVTVRVEVGPQYHVTNGLITVVAKCNVDDIGTVEP